MPTVSDFIAAMPGGGSRANQFRVELSFPAFVSAGALAGAKAQFLCKSASLPASSIGVAAVPFRGRIINQAGERTFDPWSVSIYNDTDFNIRSAFEQWSSGIANYTQVGGLTSTASYTADLYVHQLDRNGLILASYQFVDAFPINVSEIGLDFGANDTIEEFGVTFAYQYWQNINVA